MELFSPQTENQKETLAPQEDKSTTEQNSQLTSKKTTPIKTIKNANEKTQKKTLLNTEKLTTIKTELYTAVFSNAGGGTIKEFHLNNYLGPDSQFVNVINQNPTQNLSIHIKDLDGNPIDLTGNWVESTRPNRSTVDEKDILEYQLELFENISIKKVFSFNPKDYTIGIDINFDDLKDLIYRDVRFSWNGGLSPTEKDIKDDQTYFKSYLYQGDELEELKTKSGKQDKNEYNGTTSWGAIRTKYFVSSIIPQDPSNVRSASLSGTNDSLEIYNMSFIFDCYKNSSFLLYLGPLEYEKIKKLNVNLDVIMDFGWSFIRPVSKAVLFSLKRMHEYIPNYGVVLIVFSFLVKILVFPLTKKSYQSTSAMQQIQPQVNALRDKYKNDPQKMNQATMKLYKEKGVNPLGGCLPMILQMPLLFALFVVFRTTIELRSEPFIWWIKDLSSPDKILDLPFTIPLYGSHIAFLPILMVISTFIQQRMMTGGNQQPQQKMMQYFMTGFFFLIFNNFPSGLNLYYTLFNVLTIAQQKLMPAKPKGT